MRFLSKTNIDFISKQRLTGLFSIVLIIAGIASLIMKGGPLLSIDFARGSNVLGGLPGSEVGFWKPLRCQGRPIHCTSSERKAREEDDKEELQGRGGARARISRVGPWFPGAGFCTAGVSRFGRRKRG